VLDRILNLVGEGGCSGCVCFESPVYVFLVLASFLVLDELAETGLGWDGCREADGVGLGLDWIGSGLGWDRDQTSGASKTRKHGSGW
jgi:hypothetical protein